MNIKDGILAGCYINQDKEIEAALSSTPTLRGGNSACVSGNSIIGRDGREAVLRYFGVETTWHYSKRLMFDAGEALELQVQRWLGHSWDGKILAQEEIATKWTTDNGFDVTGRPDLVLADNEGKPVHGLELKNCSSIWTAAKVFPPGPYRDGKPEPKIDAVCQAAHYSLAHGYLPFTIVYGSTNNWHIPFTQKALRSYDKHDEYFDRRPGQGNMNIVPFISTFNLSWNAGQVVITHEDTGHTIATPITDEGIKDYYNLLGECIQQKRLPERSKTTDVYGKAQKWTFYDEAYCDYHKIYDEYDKGHLTFDQVIEQAKIIARTL